MISHAEAVATLITANGGHGYLADDILRMASKPAAYTEVYASARPDENQRAGSLGLTPHRILTRVVATSQRKAETESEAANLSGRTFTVGGETYGPLRRETAEDAIGYDGDGIWSGVSTWIYA